MGSEWYSVWVLGGMPMWRQWYVIKRQKRRRKKPYECGNMTIKDLQT